MGEFLYQDGISVLKMKNILTPFLLFLLLIGFAAPACAEYRELTSTVSADIPAEYIYHRVSDSKCYYVSPDEQTILFLELIKLANLPSAWQDEEEIQNQYYGYDTLVILSEDKTFMLNPRESYCTRAYLTAEGDTLWCDTRQIESDYVIAVRFKDYTGTRKAVFDRYCASVYGHANLWDRWRLYTGRNFWILMIAILPVMIPGARLRIKYGKNARFRKSLGYGAVCALATLLTLAMILGGQWDVAAIHAAVAFGLGFYARMSGDIFYFGV